MSSKDLKIELPDDLANELAARVSSGEFRSSDEALRVALRYYFERHTHERMQSYVQEELQAGLNEPS